MKFDDIDNSTEMGNLLIAAIGSIMNYKPYSDMTPDEIMEKLSDVVDKFDEKE